MYVYVQTEKGSAVLCELDSQCNMSQILHALSLAKNDISHIVAPDEMHCVGCGKTVPDSGLAPLSRNNRYRFGDRRTIGGFTVVQGGKK